MYRHPVHDVEFRDGRQIVRVDARVDARGEQVRMRCVGGRGALVGTPGRIRKGGVSGRGGRCMPVGTRANGRIQNGC